MEENVCLCECAADVMVSISIGLRRDNSMHKAVRASHGS